jgi:hypothetical protein
MKRKRLGRALSLKLIMASARECISSAKRWPHSLEENLGRLQGIRTCLCFLDAEKEKDEVDAMWKELNTMEKKA